MTLLALKLQQGTYVALRKRLLAMDANNLYWRSYYGLRYSALKNEDEAPTFAIHGTVNTLASLVKKYEPTHVLCAFDQGLSKHRLAIFPEYKQARRDDGYAPDPDSRTQLRTTRSLLTLFGLHVWREPDTEADDIIATCVMRWREDFDDIIVVSGDKDLRQLVDDTVTVVKPALGGKTNKGEEVWTKGTIRAHYGLEPWQLPEVWALCGDTSDGIPGVPGIGEKTAIKLVKKYGSASGVALSGEKKVVGKEGNILVAYKLIRLDGKVAVCDFPVDALRFRPSTPGDAFSRELRHKLQELQLVQLERRWGDGTLWHELVKHKQFS